MRVPSLIVNNMVYILLAGRLNVFAARENFCRLFYTPVVIKKSFGNYMFAKNK